MAYATRSTTTAATQFLHAQELPIPFDPPPDWDLLPPGRRSLLDLDLTANGKIGLLGCFKSTLSRRLLCSREAKDGTKARGQLASRSHRSICFPILTSVQVLQHLPASCMHISVYNVWRAQCMNSINTISNYATYNPPPGALT